MYCNQDTVVTERKPKGQINLMSLLLHFPGTGLLWIFCFTRATNFRGDIRMVRSLPSMDQQTGLPIRKPDILSALFHLKMGRRLRSGKSLPMVLREWTQW